MSAKESSPLLQEKSNIEVWLFAISYVTSAATVEPPIKDPLNKDNPCIKEGNLCIKDPLNKGNLCIKDNE